MTPITNTDVLEHGFLGTGNPCSKIADGFARIESHDQRVATVFLHPSIVHRFVYLCRDVVDLDMTPKTVGTMWGAHVILDADAPRNGFILASEDNKLCIRFEGPPLPASGPMVFCKQPVRGIAFMELLDRGERWGDTSLRLECTARVYAAIRKVGRDILDMETRASMLKTGVQAYVFGVTVKVSRDAHPTQIVLRDDNRVYAVLETNPAANPALKERADKVLGGALVDEYVDRMMAGLEKSIHEVWGDVSYDFDDDRLEDVKSTLMRAVAARLTAQYK